MKRPSWRHREVCLAEVCLAEPLVPSRPLWLSLHRGHLCPSAVPPSPPSFAFKGLEHSPQRLRYLSDPPCSGSPVSLLGPEWKLANEVPGGRAEFYHLGLEREHSSRIPAERPAPSQVEYEV